MRIAAAKRVVGAALLTLMLIACQPSEGMRSQWAAAQHDQKAQLAAASQRWSQFYGTSDWEGLRALYTDDAVLMTQGQQKIEGADNIIAFLQRITNAGGTAQFVFDNEEVVADSTYARPSYGFVTAKYLMTISFPGQEPVQVAGRSLLIYKWVDGEWLLWRDMDNFAPDATAENVAQ